MKAGDRSKVETTQLKNSLFGDIPGKRKAPVTGRVGMHRHRRPTARGNTKHLVPHRLNLRRANLTPHRQHTVGEMIHQRPHKRLGNLGPPPEIQLSPEPLRHRFAHQRDSRPRCRVVTHHFLVAPLERGPSLSERAQKKQVGTRGRHRNAQHR